MTDTLAFFRGKDGKKSEQDRKWDKDVLTGHIHKNRGEY